MFGVGYECWILGELRFDPPQGWYVKMLQSVAQGYVVSSNPSRGDTVEELRHLKVRLSFQQDTTRGGAVFIVHIYQVPMVVIVTT